MTVTPTTVNLVLFGLKLAPEPVTPASTETPGADVKPTPGVTLKFVIAPVPLTAVTVILPGVVPPVTVNVSPTL